MKNNVFSNTEEGWEQYDQYQYMLRMFDDYRNEIKKHNFMEDYFEKTN